MKSKRIKLPNTIDNGPATTKQLEYIQSLGILVSENATRSDAKAITDRYLDEDFQAPESLIGYAQAHEILCSSYIGYKYLHNLMFDNLPLIDLCSFFCYCVYQDLMCEIHGNLDSHLYSKVFYDFAEQYQKNFYFTTSLQEYYGDDLLTFGKNTINSPDGISRTFYGGSKQTLAYKTAYDYLKNNASIDLPAAVSNSSTTAASPRPSLFSRLFKSKKTGD